MNHDVPELIKNLKGLYQFKDKNGKLSEEYYFAIGYGYPDDNYAMVLKKYGGNFQLRDVNGNVFGEFVGRYYEPIKGRVELHSPGISRYINGYYCVRQKSPYREGFADSEGMLHGSFDEVMPYDSNGCAVVKPTGTYRYCLVDIQGNLSLRYFNYGDKIYNKFIRYDNYEYNQFFESENNKVKPLFPLIDLRKGDNNISLMREDCDFGLYCFKDKYGSLSEMFCYAEGYYGGFALVKKNLVSPYQYRDMSGNLSEKFLEATNYHKGYAVVKKELSSMYQLRDANGLLSSTTFESSYKADVARNSGNCEQYFSKEVDATTFNKIGYEKCGLRLFQNDVYSPYQFMDKDGNLSEEFFWASDYRDDGYARVQKYRNSPEQLRDVKGNLSQPYSMISYICNNGYRIVRKSIFKPWQIRDSKGNLSKAMFATEEEARVAMRNNPEQYFISSTKNNKKNKDEEDFA